MKEKAGRLGELFNHPVALDLRLQAVTSHEGSGSSAEDSAEKPVRRSAAGLHRSHLLGRNAADLASRI